MTVIINCIGKDISQGSLHLSLAVLEFGCGKRRAISSRPGQGGNLGITVVLRTVVAALYLWLVVTDDGGLLLWIRFAVAKRKRSLAA